MKKMKHFVPVFASLVLVSAGVVHAEPVPALAPQAIPPEALRAIEAANQSVGNTEIPVFDSRALSIGLGALAGVFVYNLLPGGAMVTRNLPAAVSRMGAVITARTLASSQFSMMTSAVAGGLVGDYMYRKHTTHFPSVSAEVAGRVKP